ncbi:MAG: murein biosynthesis integral membrane protein MurJ, partial [Candidatus Eremiobacteraeota bacterium]|nr:murein biosynthesis integral membrane protein MurJ [Candidatus Eremiobacteraeota bacterium]
MIGKFKHSFAKKETVAEAIVKSSVLSFISKVLGYVKYLAIAVFIGFNSKTDDYFMAIGLLGLFTIFVDVFNSIGVPNLVQALHSSEKEFRNLAGILLTFTAVLAGGITLLAAGLAPYLPHIAIGFTKANQKIISRIFFLFIPFLFFSFFFHHFGAILRSQRKFTVYFTGQFVLSLMSSILVLSILPFIRKIWVLPATLSFSQGVATLFLLFYCRPYLSFKWFWNETTKEMGGQFLYLTGTYAIGHVFMLIDNLFASLLPPKQENPG